MKRLTMRNSDGTVSQPTSTTVEDAFYRLAEYEDTGLSPSEVNALMSERRTLRNELCFRCGRYRTAHQGACAGCGWENG